MLHLHLLLEKNAKEEERVFMVNVEVEKAWTKLTKEVIILQRLGDVKVRQAKEILQDLFTKGIQEGWQRNNEWYNNPEAHHEDTSHTSEG